LGFFGDLPDVLWGLWYLAAAVTNAYKEIAHFIQITPHSDSRGFPGISLFVGSFYHEFHEWTNFTNVKPE